MKTPTEILRSRAKYLAEISTSIRKQLWYGRCPVEDYDAERVAIETVLHVLEQQQRLVVDLAKLELHRHQGRKVIMWSKVRDLVKRARLIATYGMPTGRARTEPELQPLPAKGTRTGRFFSRAIGRAACNGFVQLDTDERIEHARWASQTGRCICNYPRMVVELGRGPCDFVIAKPGHEACGCRTNAATMGTMVRHGRDGHGHYDRDGSFLGPCESDQISRNLKSDSHSAQPAGLAEIPMAKKPDLTPEGRVATFLDGLSKEGFDTFNAAERVKLVMPVFPDVEWAAALIEAAERQEARDENANSMRGLFSHLAPTLLAAHVGRTRNR